MLIVTRYGQARLVYFRMVHSLYLVITNIDPLYNNPLYLELGNRESDSSRSGDLGVPHNVLNDEFGETCNKQLGSVVVPMEESNP